MNQLLHAGTTAGGGDILAFALGHRAFIYHHHTTISSSGGAAVAASDDSGGDSSYLTELDMTIPVPATATADDSGNDKKKKQNVVRPGLDGHHEGSVIQAMAVRAADDDDDDDSVVVGVALQNKQLLMFRRAAAAGRSAPTSSYRILAHTMTDKRVTKLLFAPLLDHDDNEINNMVLVATDMLGDATAYEIPSGPSHSSTGTDGSIITTKVQRKLLLGHTASVLTDLCLVPSLPKHRSNYFLLTADRDEKIRVSYFPRCYDIYGYLLAHTAFVTSVTPLPTLLPTANTTSTTPTTPLVASTGGDGQLIVWNVQTCEKLASCAISVDGDGGTHKNVIPTKVLALANHATTTTTTLLVIVDRDPHLYGFTYCDGDGQRQLQPMKEPFTFPAVPIDFIVGWYKNRRLNGDNSDTTTTTASTPTAILAVLFQDAPYIRCYDCCTTTTTMDDNGVTTTTTTLHLTETTPNDLTVALSIALSSSSSSSSSSSAPNNDILHVPDSLLEKRGEYGIVLAKHAREDAEKSFLPNDPERLPGSKEKIVLRHAKRQQKKKQKKTKTTT
jgi:hypothetical protein